MTCDLEVELAEEVKRSFRSVELVRFTNSGTEALMTAVRLARAWTGKKKIVVFEGCYHGHSDQLLTKEAEDVETLIGAPSSQGIPAEVISNTIVVPFNDIEAVRRAVRRYRDEVAAILSNPIPHAYTNHFITIREKLSELLNGVTPSKELLLNWQCIL